MKLFAEKVAKLIDVKSIATLAMTAAFVVMSCTGKVTTDQFIAIYTVVVGFYFGTQYQKGVQEKAQIKSQEESQSK